MKLTSYFPSDACVHSCSCKLDLFDGKRFLIYVLLLISKNDYRVFSLQASSADFHKSMGHF